MSFEEMSKVIPAAQLGINTVCPGMYQGTTVPRFTPMMLPLCGNKAVVSKVEEEMADGHLVRLLPAKADEYGMIFRNCNFHTWMLKEKDSLVNVPEKKRTRLTAKNVETLIKKYNGSCEYPYRGTMLGQVMDSNFRLFEQTGIMVLDGGHLPVIQRMETCLEELEEDLDVISDAAYGGAELTLLSQL